MQRFPSVPFIAAIMVMILFSTGSEPVVAQIMQNQAVPLHHLWTLKGELSGEYIGRAIGWVGDINGDGLADFAVQSGSLGSVEPWKGLARWSCGEATPGVYLARAYDSTGKVLVTTTVVARR